MSGIDSSEIQHLLPHRYPFSLSRFALRVANQGTGRRLEMCIRHDCKSLGGSLAANNADALILEVMAQWR